LLIVSVAALPAFDWIVRFVVMDPTTLGFVRFAALRLRPAVFGARVVLGVSRPCLWTGFWSVG